MMVLNMKVKMKSEDDGIEDDGIENDGNEDDIEY